jgi:hypothetical protein
LRTFFIASATFVVTSLATPSPVAAQGPKPPAPLDSALVAAFQGSWHCAGAFANGKKIESDMTFTPDLDRHWLRVVHDDVPPNSYHAQSMWGTDPGTGKLMAVIFDNFGGARRFTSAGWSGRVVRFDIAAMGDSAPSSAARNMNRIERFTYTTGTAGTFGMRYEVSADGGQSWRLGDELRCTRR